MPRKTRDLPPHCYKRNTKTQGVKYFVRINGHGRTITLEEDFESPLFRFEYQDALSQLKKGTHHVDHRRKPGNHLLQELLADFQESNHFKTELRPVSRKTYAGKIKIINKQLGKKPFKDIRRKDIAELIDNLGAHSGAAVLAVLRRMIQWAHLRELITTDPTIGVKSKKRADKTYPPWHENHIEAFRAYWPVGSMQRLAFELLYYTGMRAADIIELGPRHMKDGEFHKTAKKNGVKVVLPIVPELEQCINQTRIVGDTFLTKVRTAGAFKNSNEFSVWFGKACKAAGVRDMGDGRPVTAHGLRKSLVIRAISRGATTDMVRSIGGWKSRAMIDHYGQELKREQLGSESGDFIQ